MLFSLISILGNRRIKRKESEIFFPFFKTFHSNDGQLYLLDLFGYAFINI